jgi:hypothetical protein
MSSAIIATNHDRVGEASSNRLAWWCAAAVVLWGIVAALVYYHQGLTLSHYDAKGHLVVARRVLDSLTPTWRQIGAVWLPLPHLLNLLPVQIDWLYRTGASGVLISILASGLAAYGATRIVLHATGSRSAAVLAVAVIASNPNLLYLQSTPMTEPLLIGLLMLATWRLQVWVDEDTPRTLELAGWTLVGAALTRYEAWPFIVAAMILAAFARWRQGTPPDVILRRAGRLAMYPACAVLAFLINSKLSTGVWFVTGGFYVPDPRIQGKVLQVTAAVGWGVQQLGSSTLAYTAAIALAFVVWRGVRDRQHATLLVPLALGAVAALPWYAFFEGHPFRVRYMVPLVAAAAVGCALFIGSLRAPARRLLALVVLILTVTSVPPFSPKAPMVLEAQWDVPHSRERRAVTACLAERRHGEAILASMGSLAHYMQELSGSGYHIADFVHEGNGEIWVSALKDPSRYVGWILTEEQAEGGDELAKRAREHPAFVSAFTRVCSAGGVALYRITSGLPIAGAHRTADVTSAEQRLEAKD